MVLRIRIGTLRFFSVLAAVLVLMDAEPSLAATDSCTCYEAGRQAYKDFNGCYGTGPYATSIGCPPSQSGGLSSFGQGCNDRSWGNSDNRASNCRNTRSGTGSQNNNTGTVGGPLTTLSAPGEWYLWGGGFPAIGGSCSGGQKNYGGYCFHPCEEHYTGYRLNRGNICVRCPFDESTVQLEANGTLTCFK
ncbi:MAG: hypothetical protein ACPGOY_02300 [Rhodospirillaceae bacterium]